MILRVVKCPLCKGDRAVFDGGWLREQRALAGLSIAEAASAIGVTKGFLSDVERNVRLPTPRIVEGYKTLKGRDDVEV